MPRNCIYASICVLICSMAAPAAAADKEKKSFLKIEKDSIPFFRGLAVSADLVGPLMLRLSDWGQYEAALRVNLHDQYFPIVEIGYGKADHDHDLNTGITYRTKAPYWRVGVDVNVLKDKHTGNRAMIGLRYAYTSYDVDIFCEPGLDPIWQWEYQYAINDGRCSMHWMEAVVTVDAKIWGPFHLGWSARVKRRLFHEEGNFGKSWYVPGFGVNGNMKLGGEFNVIIEI